MEKKQKSKINGWMGAYCRILIAFAMIVMGGCALWVFSEDRSRAWVFFLVWAAYGVFAAVGYVVMSKRFVRELIGFTSDFETTQKILLEELPVSTALLGINGEIIWTNSEFNSIFGEQGRHGRNIEDYIPRVTSSLFPKDQTSVSEFDTEYKGREYKAEVRRIFRKNWIAIYLHDVTLMNRHIRETEEQRLVSGLIYLDNFDEVMEQVEEIRQSLLIALVDRKINQYVGKVDGIVKKIDTDKYFIAVKNKYFKDLEEDKFSLLEDVKTVNIGNRIPVTLSMGFGSSIETYAKSYTYARVAIDQALARGGDQAVIKTADSLLYFGGKREQTSKNTRVKARIKAEALRELIMVNDNIFIMGHKMMDPDSFGAAVGIYRCAMTLGKKAHIVINEVTTSLRPLYESIVDEDYPGDMFMSCDEALSMAENNALTVVVDTNKPEMTECEELLSNSNAVVVLDHHRQGSQKIENALLSYIEPYASSTCEMVAEILQYIADEARIPSLEAGCLYAGIMIDTNGFTNRTGVRTFEAAAFLKKSGADITMIRKKLRGDIEGYRAKAEIISSAVVYRDIYAIATGENLDIESPTIVGAQAANELLDINSIKASFVLTTYHGKIYVSARSIDEVNVQVIMENMGGGGHMNASGVQINNTNMNSAVEKLKDVIDSMTEKGEI